MALCGRGGGLESALSLILTQYFPLSSSYIASFPDSFPVPSSCKLLSVAVSNCSAGRKKSHPMSLHTATFAIIYGLLFRKHAFPHPDTLNMACTAAHIAVHWIRLIVSIQPLYYAFPGFHVTPGCSSVTDAIHWNQRGKVSIANIVFTWIFSIYEAGM